MENEGLILSTSRILCTVSGGRDSMVLLDLVKKLGFRVEVAHVNYMLRGQDALHDEELVSKYCARHSIPFHVKRLTSTEAKDLKASNLQEKARNIRYRWFQELDRAHTFDAILVAHHREDAAETFMLNTMRKSGLRGLRSIQAKRNKMLRPLLSCSRSDITDYAVANGIPIAEDASNAKDDYDRNFLRNQVFAKLKERWPNAPQQMAESAQFLSNDFELLQTLMLHEKEKWIKPAGANFNFGPISSFNEKWKNSSLAFHLLSPFNFSADQINNILTNSGTGALFHSPTHQGNIDRDLLIISKKQFVEKVHLVIHHQGAYKTALGQINLEDFQGRPSDFYEDATVEIVDSAKLDFPLTVTHWSHGDKMAPLGMGGKSKLISDLLTDRKVNAFEKENTLVLKDRTGAIIWLVQHCLSEHIKSDKKTISHVLMKWHTNRSE